MNLFISLKIFVLITFCACELLKIKSACLIEHNFWDECLQIAEPDKGYFFRAIINSDSKEFDQIYLNCFVPLFYYDHDKRLSYTIVQNESATTVLYPLISSGNDKKYIMVDYYFTDKSFVQVHDFKLNNLQTQCFKNFKILKETQGRTLEFTNDENTETRMHHVYDQFNKLIASNLIMLNSKIFSEDFEDLTEDPIFELYHFRNYNDCFNTLKLFLNTISHLIFVNDMTRQATFKCSENICDEFNFLKISFFKDYLKEKFKNYFESSNEELDKGDALRFFLITVKEYTMNLLLNNTIFLPLGGSYTNEYHLDQISTIFIECIIKFKNYITPAFPLRYCQKFHNEAIKDVIKKQEEISLKDIYDHEHILEYFSKFLKKDVDKLKDYVEIEKIVCDYFNMIKYLSEIFDVQCFKYDYFYTKPIFIDNYKCRIIEGIDIKFDFSLNPIQIRTYNREGQEILLTQNIDYFYNSKASNLFISFENILSKNIYEIEVISSENKVLERFRTDDYFLN